MRFIRQQILLTKQQSLPRFEIAHLVFLYNHSTLGYNYDTVGWFTSKNLKPIMPITI